jgi:Bacterial PH domain
MPLYFGANDKDAVRWHLPWLYEAGLLQEGEILCEVEDAMYDERLGALVVTDRAVVFGCRDALGSHHVVVAVELGNVVSVEIRKPTALRRAGVLVLKRRATSDASSWTEFENAELGRFANLLDDDEIVLGCADGSLGFRSGLIAVTTRHLRFFTGGVFTRNRSYVCLPYSHVTAVRIDETNGDTKLVIATSAEIARRWQLEFRLDEPERSHDLEALIEDAKRTADDEPGAERTPVEIEFERIAGGQERAKEIAATILRQQRVLAQADPQAVDEPEVDEAPEDPLPRVRLGRGVVRWVNANGGRLYVWGADFSDLFDQMEASVRPPEGVEFVQTAAIADFELYVEDGMSWTRPIELDRRWFGLRPGVTVTTGLHVSTGV